MIYAELRSIFSFFVIGGMAALVHIGLAVGLIECCDFSVLLANLIAFLFAVNISFWGHYNWTFPSGVCIKRAYVRFLKIASCAFIVCNVLLVFLVDINLLNNLTAIVLANLITPVVSFIINKMWSFAKF
jgi:putative flippase GtrA